MASGMEINHVAIPSPMDEKGQYTIAAEIIGRNGMGLDVQSFASTVTWVWQELSKTEYAWWYTTVLGGVASAAFTHAKLFNPAQTLATYSYCIVHRPTFEKIAAGAYVGVTLEISHIQ